MDKIVNDGRTYLSISQKLYSFTVTSLGKAVLVEKSSAFLFRYTVLELSFPVRPPLRTVVCPFPYLGDLSAEKNGNDLALFLSITVIRPVIEGGPRKRCNT